LKRFKSVDDYIEDADAWTAELRRLREILQSTALVEDVKWGAPCYTHNGKNVVGLAAFKGWVCLWFHQGALLTDSSKVLINAQEGTTKALRRYKGAKAAFRKLTPGKQREYAEHVVSAKRDDTRLRRIEKVLPMITAGIGLHDKYRNC